MPGSSPLSVEFSDFQPCAAMPLPVSIVPTADLLDKAISYLFDNFRFAGIQFS
jgi:hypothetical protein